jgi:hypothetical protein
MNFFGDILIQSRYWRRLWLSCAGASLLGMWALGAAAEGAQAAPMTLGVVTHFAQGWGFSWLARAAEVSAANIRDEEPWGAIEWAPGDYRYSNQLGAYPEFVRRRGMKMLLVFMPVNPLYENGQAIRTPQGQQAFADFIVAQLNHFPGQVSAIEIGNEINGDGGLPGIPAARKVDVYASILRAVYKAVKSSHPEVAVLGGSTNVIAVGFLDALFQAGALSNMDGVVVHPYRDVPEQVDDELRHLSSVMGKYGPSKPIYATEFGSEFKDPDEAPPFMLKMVTLMASANVTAAYWYVLSDEKWFHNMGLYESIGGKKPAAEAFSTIQTKLLPSGNPTRQNPDVPHTFIFRFGSGPCVMWGATRAISFSGNPQFFDPAGNSIPKPTELSDIPFIVTGTFTYQLGESDVIADSMLDYGTAGQWSYFVQTADRQLHPLKSIDWNWTSYIGDPNYRPLAISHNNIVPAGRPGNEVKGVERLTIAQPQEISITGRLAKTSASPDGFNLQISHNGVAIYDKVITGDVELSNLVLKVHAGDTLDFAVGSNGDSVKGGLAVRFQVHKYSAN